MFDKILIANRGEIALRIIRTCREMGIRTVGVFSDADRTAIHVRMADEAYHLGSPQPAESYLCPEKIIARALESGAQAVHPGYGFLAENASFAEACTDAGLTFIGPSAAAIRVMGDKISARQVMIDAGVPVVPGTAEPLADVESAASIAAATGYPVMLKAAAGGGGKGIRIVHRPEELEGAFSTAAGEAAKAFGDARLYIEKYLDEPRHIEVQILADQRGGCVHLGERECSIQRRHQKLIEETPSVVVDEDLRARMGAVAVRAAQAIEYTNAGTIEFMYSRGEFYFLEMNTRLQVEHPVTEMVTGVDLVREQLRVAAGEALGYEQEQVQRTGHAIEVRINAEDSEANFMPSTGRISNLRLPGGPWVRIDSSLYRGLEVGLDYDPLLAKLIAWGPDREQAIARTLRALRELHIGGVRTSAAMAIRILSSAEFRRGETDTHFLGKVELPRPDEEIVEMAALATAVHRHVRGVRNSLEGANTAASSGSPWAVMGRNLALQRWK